MKFKKDSFLWVIVVIMIFGMFNIPVIANTTESERNESTASTNNSTDSTISSTSIIKTEESEIGSSQKEQEEIEDTTLNSEEAPTKEDDQKKKKESDMMAEVWNEYFWWDTINNRRFSYNDDIPFWGGGNSKINTTQGYIELGEPYMFEVGWKFVNITFRGEVYSPGDRIYDDIFKGPLDFQEMEKHLRYNYEPQLYNVKISYRGLPDEIKETLPKTDPNPILNGTMYTIPDPPKVEGYIAEEFALVWTAPYFTPRMIGSEIYISGGTFSDGISYGYRSVEEMIAQPVISRYIDIEGNAIDEESSMIGEIDEEYATSAKTIPGYTLVKIEGTINGKFTSKQQEVNYIYIKDDSSNFVGSYVDYAENTVTSITDIERQLKIVKNVNLSLVNYNDNKLNVNVVGTTQQFHLLGTIQTATKRVQTKNGRIYYVLWLDGKQYMLHSDAFQALPTSSDFEQESDLDKYASVSLDFLGNYLDKINSVNYKISLVNNYNVYDLLKTDGDAAIPPYTGTVSSMNLKDNVFTVTQEFVSSYGIKYYKIMVEGYSYFVNAAAFVVESIKDFFW
ncbi:MucBP domain-containing protein [Candidatus Enterococcus murrayae]|uniref:MucBP domain-containing protein n=1 Tax=Candidatus Enterococcus murrayae TaxID=2815321 RepID=A0ABS3HDD3_9ENTE|nr:MucBP domain-containing protein [Enterococcus sp. MJM16]MBO0451461.1 MucBP domain-containing protein [Enterococcus sp. MJM16]